MINGGRQSFSGFKYHKKTDLRKVSFQAIRMAMVKFCCHGCPGTAFLLSRLSDKRGAAIPNALNAMPASFR
jgi:hypothetical protein